MSVQNKAGSTPAVISQPASYVASESTSASVQSATSRPLWQELTESQQQALAPLAKDWNSLDAIRKKKWLEIARKYPKMPPEDQQRIHARMRDWIKLTPEQRRLARESYALAKKLDPEQKSAKWQQYQNLSEEEKKKLAEAAEKKKQVANLPRSLASNKIKPSQQTPPAVIPSPPAESVHAPAPTMSAPVAAPAVVTPPVTSQPESTVGPPSYLIN